MKKNILLSVIVGVGVSFLSFASAEQGLLIEDDDVTAPRISPVDELCGLHANITTCPNIVNWDALDSSLQPMMLPDGSVFYAYIRPHVSTFYQATIPEEQQRQELQEVTPRFTGIAGRFVNMSPENLALMWIPNNDDARENLLISHVGAFEQAGTATFVGHEFCLAPANDNQNCIKNFEVKQGVSRYTYNPFEGDKGPDGETTYNVDDLEEEQLEKYEKLLRAEEFAKRYKRFTGREYWSTYPRSRPMHYMYSADYFGQTHVVETKETHFVKLPPEEVLGRVSEVGSKRKLKEDEVSFS